MFLRCFLTVSAVPAIRRGLRPALLLPGRGGDHQAMARRGRDERFDAFKLSASHGALSGTVDPARLPRLADRVVESAPGHVEWSIRGAADAQGRPAITLALEGRVPLECQRCLGLLEQDVHQSTTLLLARSEAEMVQLDESSDLEVVLANAPLDPGTLVEDELLLTLPFAPRHEADCTPAAA